MELLCQVAVGTDRVLIVVTHDARIFEFASRIAKMDDGHIISVTNTPRYISDEKKELGVSHD